MWNIQTHKIFLDTLGQWWTGTTSWAKVCHACTLSRKIDVPGRITSTWQKNYFKISQTRLFSFATTLTFGFSLSQRPSWSCVASSDKGQDERRGGWCTSMMLSGHLLISSVWHNAGSLKREKREHQEKWEGMATARRVMIGNNRSSGIFMWKK